MSLIVQSMPMVEHICCKSVVLTAIAAAAGGALAWRAAAVAGGQAVKELQAALVHEQEKRAADRAGRIRAEQKLKQLNLQLAQQTAIAQVSACAAAASTEQAAVGDTHSLEAHSRRVQQQISVYPFAPIGVLRSCFNDRRGTPRQPHLVPAARAALHLGPGIPAACLRGLEGFSHCWVIYVFHENTDLAKLMLDRAATAAAGGTGGGSSGSSGGSQIKALISVPRLNGGKMGVLATRSPHRPVPIGLSTAQIVSVDAAAGVLVLGGVDVVDGSPVLDIKPYVPFSDALPDAAAPDWVKAAADEEPLALSGVSISPAAQQQLDIAWHAVQHNSLYKSPQQLTDLVQQVLSRDIRSLHQRRDVAPVAVQEQAQQQQQHRQDQPQHAHGSKFLPAEAAELQQMPTYTVTLDGVVISYSLHPDTGHVSVLSAAAASATSPSQQHGTSVPTDG